MRWGIKFNYKKENNLTAADSDRDHIFRAERLQLLRLSVLLFLLITVTSGCTRDDPAAPEEENGDGLLWEGTQIPLSCNRIISLDISDNGTVYVLTDDQHQYPRSSEMLYRSEDGGESWREFELPDDPEPCCITVDRDNNLYALPGEHTLFSCVYISADAGVSWDRIELDCSGQRSLLFDSRNRGFLITHDALLRSSDRCLNWDNVLEEDIISFCLTPDDRIYALSDTAFFFSESSGDTWTRMESPVNNGGVPEDITAGSDGTLYILDGDFSESELDLYRSSDGGNSWTVLDSIYRYSGNSPPDLLAADDNTLFCSYYNYLLKSVDNGDSWEEVYSGYFKYDLFKWEHFRGEIILKGSPEGDLFAADEVGLYRTGDSGESWVLAGLPAYHIQDIFTDASGRIWITYLRGGVYRFEEGFDRFRQFNSGLDNYQIYCLEPAGGSAVLAGTASGVFRASLDEPEWENIGPGHAAIYEIYSGDENYMAVTAENRLWSSFRNGIYRTEDGGESWDYLGMEGYDINCVEGDEEGSLYTGTEYGGVFRYSGSGEVWEQLNSNIPALRINDLEFDPEGRLNAATADGVCRFEAERGRWAGAGMKGKEVNALFASGRGVMFAASENRIFRRETSGSGWRQCGQTNDPGSDVIGLFRADSLGYIYPVGDFELLWRSADPWN